MEKDSKILILGANGMVGKSLYNKLINDGYDPDHISRPSSCDVNLTNQERVNEYMSRSKFDYVFFLAAKVGGIMANIKSPAEFGYDNTMMELNVIHAAYKSNVKKLLFMGSSCIYPRECQQPMKEEYLLNGPVEPTNEMYALAKIMGLKLCESYNKQYGTQFISCMPSNIYGPNDNFDLQSSHVMSAMIQKFYKARCANDPTVTCFGTGNVYREFIHVFDVADACVFLMDNYKENSHINVGTGKDITIRGLAHLVSIITDYQGKTLWDASKPDGMPRKVVDVSKINALGWKSKIDLEDGIRQTYNWYIGNNK